MQNKLNQRAKSLPEQQKMIFMLICNAPMKKIELRKKTNMAAVQLDKILKELASINLIKAIKTPASKNQNVWVRSDYNVQQIKKVDYSVVQALKQKSGNIEDIKNQLKRKGYDVNDLESLIDMLVNKGEIYFQNNRVWKRQLEQINNPCLQCPVFEICNPSGAISPLTCIYFEQW